MFSVVKFVLVNIVITAAVSSRDCPHGHFRVPRMAECHRWLTCEDLLQITVLEVIGQGAVKRVHRARWRGDVEVAVSFLNSVDLAEDFRHNREMLELFGCSPLVVQLVGFCAEEGVLVTQYHRLGDAADLAKVLPEGRRDERSALRLCHNYASLISHLHSGPGGPRVMCDSADLGKLLGQLLVTDDRTLVLNDLDALPLVRPGEAVKCGRRELSGDFVAPEQRWPHPGPFRDESMPGYGVETDIWKLATVCEAFLQYVPGSEASLYSLYALHRRCKSPSPASRPAASELVEAYGRLLADGHDEL
ncbi:protein O-mannose kinase-like [Bacillus rossius redtenbacheri]|uniref:protein O-mannose kinase-like n=1 Tax=Bacillus rossius redtenbacheri TaxID=93214 RepID=UPI002FDE1F88